jgi:hypothetical protein
MSKFGWSVTACLGQQKYAPLNLCGLNYAQSCTVTGHGLLNSSQSSSVRIPSSTPFLFLFHMMFYNFNHDGLHSYKLALIKLPLTQHFSNLKSLHFPDHTSCAL